MRVALSTIQTAVIRFLDMGPASRADISGSLGIPRTTLFDNLHQLEVWGYVRRYYRPSGNRGRPNTIWELTDEGKSICYQGGQHIVIELDQEGLRR